MGLSSYFLIGRLLSLTSHSYFLFFPFRPVGGNCAQFLPALVSSIIPSFPHTLPTILLVVPFFLNIKKKYLCLNLWPHWVLMPAWGLSSRCRERGLLSTVVCRPLIVVASCGRAQALGMQDPVVVDQRLSRPATWDLNSWSRVQTCVLCIARQILNHWATRKVPIVPF